MTGVSGANDEVDPAQDGAPTLVGDAAPVAGPVPARATFDDVRMQARLRQQLFGTGDDPIHLGRYRVDELIGRGGMGSVYAAHDPELDRRVAIKLFSGAADGDRIRAVRREARALAASSHPNVVQVYEIGEADGRPFVVMELVEGESLGQWLGRHREPTRERFRRVRELLLQTGRGLAAAHAVGLVHRDVKPSNVLVGRDGRVRVADFGLAWLRDGAVVTRPRGASESTGSSVPLIAGTPAYMAPEQFDRGDVDAAADQYAFCVTAFEAIYGHGPFASSDPFVARDEIVVPVRRGVPRWIGAPILRGLAIDRRERFATMDELLHRMARPRGRGPTIALGLALAGVAVAVTVGGESTPPVVADPCAPTVVPLGEWWSDGVSDRLTSAFVRVNASDGTQVATMVGAGMTAYGRRFDLAWQRACTTSLEDSRAARLRCLGDRRAEVVALVDQLLQPDPDVVAHAVDAVAQLSDPEPCDRVDPSVASNDDDVHDDRRHATTEALSRSQVAENVGRAPEAVAWAAAAEAMAAASGADDLRARALVLLGATISGPSRIPPLERAWELASRAHDDQAAGEAAVSLMGAYGAMPDGLGQELVWRGHADAALRRLGDDTELRAIYYKLLAERASMHGDHHEALDFAERALAEYDRMASPPLDARARVTVTMGQALAHLDNELAAIEAYRAGLVLMELSGVQHHVDFAYAANKYAASLTHVGAFDEADVQYRRGLAALRAVPGVSPRIVGVMTSDYGQGLFMQGRFAEAIATYEEALRLLAQPDGGTVTNIGVVQLNLAHALRFAGESERARTTYERAVVVFEVEQARVYHCRALIGIGDIELAEGRPAKALASFTRARAALGDDQSRERLSELLGTADAQLQLGRAQLARRAVDQAQLIADGSPLPGHRIAGIRLRQARVAEALGDHDAAIASYREAIELYAHAQPYTTGSRADSHWELAQVLSHVRRFAEAREQATLAVAAWDELPERYAAESLRAKAWLADHDPARRLSTSGRRSSRPR